jgi:ATP-dependent RNA helicase DDX55/SPB4
MWNEFQKKNEIDQSIIDVINDEFKFDKITKVQNIVIPLFIKHKDVIVKSCTGSGKTLAYLIPVFHYLLRYKKEESVEIKNKVLCIIMLPSRELSVQVFNLLLKFVPKHLSFTFSLLIGGKKIQHDLDKLAIEIPNIIVATPGRLHDLEDKVQLNFKDLQLLILDEADKMLELGYEAKLNHILSKCPKQRRTGLFSATVNSEIENLIKVGMRNPVFVDIKINNDEDIFVNDLNSDEYFEVINIDSLQQKREVIAKFSQEIPKQLVQNYVLFNNVKYKFPTLIKIINEVMSNKPTAKIMIFFATCNVVEYMSIVLKSFLSTEILKLHSKISQKKRKKEYKNFLSCAQGILLTTDLSSRGIDVPNLDMIIQYDPPKNEEVYIHRVGRTARVGNSGESIIFLLSNEENFIKYMGNKTININRKDIEVAQDDEVLKRLKEVNISDKWIYEKAVKAFVSFVRFYQEHDLKYIFDLKVLDIGNLANSFQLLRLPRLKEILGKKIENFEQDNDINPNKDLVYKSDNIAKQMNEKEEKINKMKEQRQVKRDMAKRKLEEAKRHRTKKEKKIAKVKTTIKEWDEFANEAKMYKKFKQGKISKDVYDSFLLNTK